MVHRRLAFLVAVFSVLAVAACGQKPTKSAQNEVAAASSEPKPVAPISLPAPKLEREQLILAALRAISATALGSDDSGAQKQLEGREFELRLRFGCPDRAAGPSRSWSYDGDKQVLRAHVDADLAGKKVPASDILLKGYEGVVGFTIERPLLLSVGCPTPEFAAFSSTEPTIAVAQLFTSEDSRVQRPERSYEITKAVEPEDKPTKGLDLVISGRLSPLADGRVIHCAASDGPPACVIAAKFDRVAIENPANDAVLGEWSQW